MILGIVGVVAGLSFLTAFSAQDLDDAALEKAIQAGRDNKHRQWIAECKADATYGEGVAARLGASASPTGSYQLVLSTNLGGISYLAAEAKRLSRPFSIADIPEWIRGPGVHLFVDPVKPGRNWGSGVLLPSSIDRVILRSKADKSSVAESARLETQDVVWDDRTHEWLRSQGGVVTVRGGVLQTGPMVFEKSRATATFRIDALKALPAGDVELVVMTRDGERRCAVGARDRLRLVP